MKDNFKIKKLLQDIRHESLVAHKAITKETMFCAYDYLILEYIFDSIDKNTYEFGASVFIIANDLWINESDVISSLRRLANYGIINCISEITEKRSLNYQISINPTVYGIVTVVGFTKNYKAVISHMCRMGYNRLCRYETPIQGFRIDTNFGDVELEKEPYDSEKEILKILEKSSEDKAIKESNNNTWRILSNEFVAGCSQIWVMAQSMQGYGSALPNWALEDCPAKVRAERNELVKTFKQYGGRVSALAWMLFVGGITELDENGKIKYSVTCPHRQFVTSDKKPSQFTKNFNSILKDPILHEWAEKEWPIYYELLKEKFNSSIDTKPKQGDEYILSGIKFHKLETS